METIRRYWDEFTYSMKNIRWFGVLTTLLIGGAIGLAIWSYVSYNKTISRDVEKDKTLKNANKVENAQFTILAEQKSTNKNGTINLVYDAYNMKPYTDPSMINSRVQKFISNVKSKYNEGTHNKVAAVAIRVYNRKLTFNYGYTPNALYEYALSADSGGLDNTSDDSHNQYARTWQASNNQKGIINYNKYDLTRQGILQTNENDPLSDEEFAFWLKLRMYEDFLDTSVIDSAAKAYLNFDLGATTDYNSVNQTVQRFEDFDQRIRNNEGSTDYFPNKTLLRESMVMYRPQLAYFLLTGKIENSYTKAQKNIVKMDPDKYKSVISDHLDKAGKEHGGNVLFDDPFKPVTGNKKSLERNFKVPFAPTLKQNNLYFPLAPQNTVTVDDVNKQ